MNRARVGISGGAGYLAGELVRILLDHPNVELAQIASRTFPNQPLYHAHPNLRGHTTQTFVPEIDPAGLDVIFLARTHGEAMVLIPRLLARAPSHMRWIDLSGDFRLKEAALYPIWYGREHASTHLLPEFVYGLTEWNRDAIARARFVANPGCFATAMALAAAPLAKAGFAGTLRVAAVTGSSGSGARPGEGTHHPTRAATLRAYKPLIHQHVPEGEQLLTSIAGRPSLRLALVPVSGPIVRGIYAICQTDLPPGADATDAIDLYQSAYGNQPFVRLLDSPPDLAVVTGTNYCDLHVVAKDAQIAVLSSLDNLIKGGAGQAVQNLNIMMGWNETEGLRFPGIYP